MLGSVLNIEQLQTAVAAAKRQFEMLQKKYPALKAKDKEAYLVLSLPSGQTGIDSFPAQILSEFPGMVVAGSAPHFQYNEKTQIEIRFKDLNYELIWKLQADDLIDRNLTPQTKASIQIVLGTLARFDDGNCAA